MAEKIKEAKAPQGPAVIASAQSVIEQIEARLDGADIITTLRGSYKAVIIGSGRATVIHPSGQAEKDK